MEERNQRRVNEARRILLTPMIKALEPFTVGRGHAVDPAVSGADIVLGAAKANAEPTSDEAAEIASRFQGALQMLEGYAKPSAHLIVSPTVQPLPWVIIYGLSIMRDVYLARAVLDVEDLHTRRHVFLTALGLHAVALDKPTVDPLKAMRADAVGCGMAIAAGIACGMNGDDVVVREIMASAGLKKRETCMKIGVDEFDLDKLKPYFAARREDAREEAEQEAYA